MLWVPPGFKKGCKERGALFAEGGVGVWYDKAPLCYRVFLYMAELLRAEAAILQLVNGEKERKQK